MAQPLAKSTQILNDINVFLMSPDSISEFEVAKLKRQALSCEKPESFALLAAISSLIQDKDELLFNVKAALRYNDHWAAWVSYVSLFNADLWGELCELIEARIYHLDDSRVLDMVNISAMHILNYDVFLKTKQFSFKNDHAIMYKNEDIFHFLNDSDNKNELTDYIKHALYYIPLIRTHGRIHINFDRNNYDATDSSVCIKILVDDLAMDEVSDVEFEWLRKISESNINPEIRALISFGMECRNG
jgi:hypothetical protein